MKNYAIKSPDKLPLIMRLYLSIFVYYFVLITGNSGASAQIVNDTGHVPLKDTCCLQQDIVDLFFKGDNPFRTKTPHRFRAFTVPLVAFDAATVLCTS